MFGLGRIAVLSAAAFLPLVLAPSAGAASSTVPPTGSFTITSEMVVVGFDPAVAAAHGFTIKRDRLGRTFSVPTSSAATATTSSALASPILTGSCGTSYIHFNAIGLRKATLVTGFGLVYSAVFYGWHVHVIDGIGVGNLDWGGGLLLSRTWEASTVTHSGTTGYAQAVVDTSSYATLANGAVCHSLGPWDSTRYYN